MLAGYTELHLAYSFGGASPWSTALNHASASFTPIPGVNSIAVAGGGPEYSSGGLDQPAAVAVDGAGLVWASNSSANANADGLYSVSEIAPTESASRPDQAISTREWACLRESHWMAQATFGWPTPRSNLDRDRRRGCPVSNAHRACTGEQYGRGSLLNTPDDLIRLTIFPLAAPGSPQPGATHVSGLTSSRTSSRKLYW